MLEDILLEENIKKIFTNSKLKLRPKKDNTQLSYSRKIIKDILPEKNFFKNYMLFKKSKLILK